MSSTYSTGKRTVRSKCLNYFRESHAERKIPTTNHHLQSRLSTEESPGSLQHQERALVLNISKPAPSVPHKHLTHNFITNKALHHAAEISAITHHHRLHTLPIQHPHPNLHLNPQTPHQNLTPLHIPHQPRSRHHSPNLPNRPRPSRKPDPAPR